MPTDEQIAAFNARENDFTTDEKAAALGWNGPRKDPNYDDNGQWTGPVPDYDRPVNEQYNAARVPRESLVLDDAGIRARQAQVDLDMASSTWTGPDPQVYGTPEWDTWARQFTEGLEGLGHGHTWGYVQRSGDIRLYQSGNAVTIFRNSDDFPATMQARAWLNAEKVKQIRVQREEFLRAEDDRRRAEEAANATDNPLHYPAMFEKIMTRLDAIEQKLGL